MLIAAAALLLSAIVIADRRWQPAVAAEFSDQTGPVIIRVNGSEYRWQFRLPGPDGRFDTRDDPPVSHTLQLPPDTEVQFELTSSDYVYSMLLPDLGLKQICVPGMTHALNLRTPSEGEYEMPVGSFCGVSFLHDGPMGILKISHTRDTWRNLGCRP